MSATDRVTLQIMFFCKKIDIVYLIKKSGDRKNKSRLFLLFSRFDWSCKSFKNSLKIILADVFHGKSFFRQCFQRDFFAKVVQIRSGKAFSLFRVIFQIHICKQNEIQILYRISITLNLPWFIGILLAATLNISSLLW